MAKDCGAVRVTTDRRLRRREPLGVLPVGHDVDMDGDMDGNMETTGKELLSNISEKIHELKKLELELKSSLMGIGLSTEDILKKRKFGK